MPALSEMTGEQIAAWAAGNDQDAVASPSDASPPPAEAVVAPVEAEAVEAEAVEEQPAEEPAPDLDAMAQELAALKAAAAEREAEEQREQAEEERAKAARDAEIAENLRTEEHKHFVQTLRELHEVDPEAAKKVAQSRSFLEQDRAHFQNEAMVSAKMVDAISLAIETVLTPEQMQQVVATAQTLMPYSSYDDMQGFIGTQKQQAESANSRISQLEAELNEAKRALAAQARNPAIDAVERGGGSNGPTGLPGRLSGMTPQQKAEWAAQAPTATY